MKMMYAGLLSDPNLEPEQLRFNCTRNPALQKAFYIPIRDIGQIDLYFELPFLPLSYSIHLIDYCNSGEIALTSDLYVIGEHPNGFYGVFSNLVAAGDVPTLFYIKGEFVAVDGTTTAIFFSNDFSTIDCGNLTKVEGCYNNATTGTEAYDINGVYYGFPINSNFLGNQLWRYFHSVDVRLGKVTNTKHKLSLSLFNSSRNYKSTTEKTYNFQSELVPEFYKDEIAGVITRGNITINGKPYTLSSDVELSVLSEDSELWPIDIPLTDNIDTFFSCKETVCRTLGEPPPLCCDPVVTSTQIEVISGGGNPTEVLGTVTITGGNIIVSFSSALTCDAHIFIQGSYDSSNTTDVTVLAGNTSGSASNSNSFTCIRADDGIYINRTIVCNDQIINFHLTVIGTVCTP